MGIFGPKGARLVFSCVSAVGATKFAPQPDWDLQHSADALTADELRSHRLTPAPALATPADEMTRRNKKNPNDIQVPVFYATNREPLSAAERQRHPRKFFGQVGKTSPGLNLGLGRVRIREDAFKLANLQDERDARRLEEIAPCKDEAEWKTKLREALNGDVKKSIIVFVHGCFTDFPRGLEYGGLVKHGCNFSGPMVVFSWPSIGHKVQSRPYAKDEKSVKWSVPQLKEFLHMLLTEFEAKVHVLSYSMGARAVVGALDLLEEEVLALDEKLKKDGTQLRDVLQDKLRSVVTRGEEAAAGMKVGVRELGNILARERDLLKEKAASLRVAPLDLNNGPDIKASGDLGYGQCRVAGYGEGLPLTRGAGEAKSPRSGGMGPGEERGLGLTAGVREGVSKERVREWEALRSKLGHMVFMAPDEEVERFRDTARRWTQSLRNRVSGQTQGASEEVKERVRTDLEADGPQAIEEAAKRGGTRSGDVILAGKVAGLSVGIPRLLSSPAVLQGGVNKLNERSVVPPPLNLALTSTRVSVTPKFSDWQSVLGSDGAESGQDENSGEEKELAENAAGDGADRLRVVSPSRLTTIFSGKVLDLNSRGFVKPVSGSTSDLSRNLPLETASDTPALSLAIVESSPVTFPTGADSPPHNDVRSPSADVIFPSADVSPPAADVISPGVIERAFSGFPRSFQGSLRTSSPSASSTSSRTPSRSSSSTDLVGEELQQALLWEHLHAAASDGYSDRSSDVSSRASSRSPSRTPSLADLGSNGSSFNESTHSGAPISGEEQLSTAGGRHLTAGGVTSSGEAGVTSAGEGGVREGAGGVREGAGGVREGAGGVTAGAGGGTAGKAGEKALWRRKSLPAMGLHLSSSAPVLTVGSLEWRFLHRPTTERHVSTSGPSPPPSADDVDDDVAGPRFSLYTSQSDWALKLAGLATTKPWARGLARMVAFGDPGKNDLGRRVGAVLLVEEGYETIDATEVSIGSRNMGHHYLFHRCILEDITHLLSGANAHKRRFEATTPDGKVYWKIERGDFKPAAPPSPALYPTWSTVHMMESTKSAPPEQQLLFFTSDEVAINFNY